MTHNPPPEDLSDLVQRLRAQPTQPPAPPQAPVPPQTAVPPQAAVPPQPGVPPQTPVAPPAPYAQQTASAPQAPQQFPGTQPTPPRRPRARRARRRRIFTLSVIGAVVLLMIGGGATWAIIAASSGGADPAAADPAPITAPRPTTAPSPTPSADPAPTTDPASEPASDPTPAPEGEAGGQSPSHNPSLDDPASITVVVNKQRPLAPITWAPNDLANPEIPNSTGQPLRYEAAVALEQMYAEASAAGVPFAIVSGFRSYDLQTSLFNNYAANYGVAAAETFSARPGHSEHQTGLAVDISECLGCPLSEAFGSMPQGLWARENAHRFGFIMRYDQGQQPVVGYVYEPWHFRYVGVDVATDMHQRGIANLEDYYGLPAAPNY